MKLNGNGVDGKCSDTRQRIVDMLGKIASEANLNRIYRFVKFIYIYRED